MDAKKQYSLAQLATLSGATLLGDAACVITSLASLDTAKAGQLSFLDNPRYQHQLETSQASAVVLAAEYRALFSGNALVTDSPRSCFATLAALFVYQPSEPPGIHPTAILGEGCQIAETASIAAYCVLGAHVRIGSDVVIGAGCSIGDYSQLGNDCYFFPNVTVYHHVKLGERVLVHSGAVLGSDGFGMVKEEGRWQKMPQLGGVRIENDVEIGANTTIDRGALEDTVIETGVKLDNHIQIAHNVIVGEHTAIAACVGVAGSTRIGKHCQIGGGSGIADHLDIADGVMMTGMTMVTKSIRKPGIYSSGTGFQENHLWHKNVARFKQLDTLIRRLQTRESFL